jgi:hypothetical protein
MNLPALILGALLFFQNGVDPPRISVRSNIVFLWVSLPEGPTLRQVGE